MCVMDSIQPVPPEQVPPYKFPASPRRRTGLVFTVVIVALLAIALAAYFFTPLGNQLKAMITPTAIPQELRGAAFLSDMASGSTSIYRFPASGKSMADAGGLLLSAAQNGKNSASITRSADGMFKVSVDGAVVLQDSEPRVGIDVAPDGKSIAFGMASDTMAFAPASVTPLLPLDRTRWNAVVYMPATHKTIVLGKGVSPFFLDATHVAWLAPAGLAVSDLTNGTSKVLVSDLTGRVPFAPLVSPDHTIVAWYASGGFKTLQVYKVTATAAQALPKTTLPFNVSSVALGNDTFYELRTSGAPTDILEQPFGGSAAVAGHILASLKVSRLLLTSQ